MDDVDYLRRRDGVLEGLRDLIRRRRAAGDEAEAVYQRRLSEGRVAYEQQLEDVARRYAAERAALEREFGSIREELNGRLRREYETCDQEYQAALSEVNDAFGKSVAQARQRREQARWEGTTVYDARKHIPRREFKEREKQIKSRSERAAEVEKAFYQRLEDLWSPREPRVVDEFEVEALTPGAPLDDPGNRWQELAQEAEALLAQLRKSFVPSLRTPFGMACLMLIAAALVAVPVGLLSRFNPGAVGGAAGVGALLGAVIAVWVWRLGGRRIDALHTRFVALLDELEALRREWLCQELHRSRRMQAEIKQRYQHDLDQVDSDYQLGEGAAAAKRDAARKVLEAEYGPKLADLEAQHTAQLQNAQVTLPQRAADLEKSRTDGEAAAAAALEAGKTAAHEQLEADWRQIAGRWKSGVEQLRGEAAALTALADGLFPAWDDPRWNGWEPSDGVAPIVRFGSFELGADRVPQAALPNDRLGNKHPPHLTVPAALAFPERSSMIIKTSGTGRAEAVQVLQTVMLRFLSSLPPGKVRFTIVDPVGLGQNFAGFMHLADYDEKLVNSRIWTEPALIEQQLADMTSHMANVIQKYLRNEYDTIEDYNRHAGEVAEPYRILVIANFPFNFTDNAARHLMSIMTSGARCGVYVLLSVDMKQRLPHGFNLSDLEANALKLIWKDQRFVCKDGEWDSCPLTLDPPPPAERFNQILNTVGSRAKEGSKVEVPFEFIAPKEGEWWSRTSGKGIDVPLGRAGATKRQNLQLGSGTSQHVLIAGKTGSGKSTMMHALITNLSLYYSPAEVELYLIDFKKGVEFKTYAEHALPHARVVAIESEREFGLSVLQRLDAELKLRGDRFRDLNVQDLNSYREATGETLPRILLIVDEFQEFFVEDDKISQETSLLLDRLVRQGRAFGVHVHLGSQTLGGAYSLARTTLGQMAIRIALQCSEADSHLILSEDNPAARLLTRPGEAIYNDANGRVEGNNLFQVVWLTDEKRENYLRRLHELAVEKHLLPKLPQIVFEGNAPADVDKNHLLTTVLTAPRWPEQVLAAHAWLGEAIAIKDPTQISFRRQSGSNALLIGQQPQASLSMLVTSAAALAAQHDADPRRGAQFFALDGSPPDAPHAGFLEKAAKAFPHRFEVGGIRDVAKIVGEIHDELVRRQAEGPAGKAEIYLFIYDLQRFRDLRKAEDDFSFNRTEEKPNPGKQIPTILREGPPLGIHTLVWCDSLNNFQRTFERSLMREFELRVLFQMSQNDSSNLIDGPAASRLGPHRALLFNEEQGLLEKFRPYSLPTDEWLTKLRTLLTAKGDASAKAAPAGASA